jgi:hypothetical protein
MGPVGGPFEPSSITYRLENGSLEAIDYTVALGSAASWLTLSGQTSGTLAPLDTALVTAEIHASAGSLGAGAYVACINFTNTTQHIGDATRVVVLAVGDRDIYHAWTFESDPGWTTEDEWAFGQPTGQGGSHGHPDPTSGHTGDNVYGYNLYGDYPNNLPERHLTSGAVDCSELFAVKLAFWRWLGVEQPRYDHAHVRVSVDGEVWTTVWSNPEEITDNAWVQQEIDISPVASGQPTVYLRWTMGTTDGGWTYCGWNVDDVELWAIECVEDPSAARDLEDRRVAAQLARVQPNPFTPDTRLCYALPAADHVRLWIADAQGRRVALLVDGPQPAGHHVISWDARDAFGSPIGSGIYFVRLETGGKMLTRRLTLVR